MSASPVLGDSAASAEPGAGPVLAGRSGGVRRQRAHAMMVNMGVRADCRHYLKRSTPTGEAVERCRINVNQENPFACPEGCLFFEPRNVSSAGWTQGGTEPLSNTGQGLIALPEPPKRGRKGKKKGR